nr:uncharacterized protein CTRU02_04032 [Colletotrichum truncatum]KAF6796072.1 hypothetical protein CTRU02_04032 [Colletotrichum truncatum]
MKNAISSSSKAHSGNKREHQRTLIISKRPHVQSFRNGPVSEPVNVDKSASFAETQFLK